MHLPIERELDTRISGLPTVGNVPWGTHLCHFYRDRSDLLEALIPFFKAGLENNERCLWITSEPLPATEAREALGFVVRDLPERIKRGQMEILDYRDWYLRADAMSAEDVLRGWLDYEAAALNAGYDGLRLSGNTLWLERNDWPAFSAYEACVHRVFHSQRIIALCSYSLGKCSANDIIDVLRNHRFALVRRDGRWESIQSATLLLAVNAEAVEEPGALEVELSTVAPTKKHAVRFFEEAAYPAERICDYLQEGLAAGNAAVMFATQQHIDQVLAVFAERGEDIAPFIECGQFVFRAAEEIAQAIAVDRTPDKIAFDRIVADAVDIAVTRFGYVRAYGEIVDVLAGTRNHAAAIRLEQWWNQLLHTRSVELLCGYTLDHFAEATSAFHHVCGEHGHVEADTDTLQRERGHVVAELRQTTLALQVAERQRDTLKREHSDLRHVGNNIRLQAELAHKHLACLQELTSVMAEAATSTAIGRAVVSELKKVFNADIAALAVEKDNKLVLLGQINMTPLQAEKFLITATDAPFPIAQAYRSGSSVWLMSAAEILEHYPAVAREMPDVQIVGCMPLILRGHPIGAIALIYKTPYKYDAVQHALLLDYVKQIALAVERVLIFEEAQRARTRLQILADAGNRIAQAKLDLTQVLCAVTQELTRQRFSHLCAISLRDDSDERPALVALHDVNPDRNIVLNRLLSTAPTLMSEATIDRIIASGKSARVIGEAAVTQEAHPAYHAHLANYPASCLIVAPLRASGKIIGTLAAMRYTPSEPFTCDDEQLVADLADRAALSIKNALLYERAQRERERAELANSAKDEFLAMLGHELRNPLSPILTAAQLMRLRGGDLLAKERTIIERQVYHMVRLVDDLLDISRITRGKVDLRRAPIELADVVANAIELASPLLEERRHRLLTSISPSRLLVDVDTSRMSQVIANLLTNAAKYTPPEGSIEVSAIARDGNVTLRVIDNGIGITAELLPNIFDLFLQGKQEIDRAQGGLGLGLTIARRLVEMHGGKLSAKSEGPGRGSQFILELPLVTKHALPDSALEQPMATASVVSRKILIVDDNTDAAESLAALLQILGHHVRTAPDGPSALTLAEEAPPDLALLDIGLPGMDGYELAERLTALLGNRAPKLIAITGYGQASDRIRSEKSGFHSHLVKPVDFERVQTVVDELFATPQRATYPA